MANITKEFTYKIPDEWGFDEFTQGKTGTYVYEGPEFLTFEVCNDPTNPNYGKETGWCLWEPADLERPCALDVTRITVDCKEEPFLCEIANDQGKDSDNEFRTNRQWTVQYATPEGYEDVHKPLNDEVIPRDIYDEWNITYDFETEEFNVPVRTFAAQGVKMDLTWAEVRLVRNELLQGTDGRINDDMPEALKQKYRTYRQLLRDLPAQLEAEGYEPWQVMMMFPRHPDGDNAPPPEMLGG